MTEYFAISAQLLKSNKFFNLEQTPLNGSQQLPAPYKQRNIDGIKQNQLQENDWTTYNNYLTNNKQLFNCDNRQIETHQ